MPCLRGELAALSLAAATLVLAFTLVGSAAQLPGVGGGAQVASFLVLTLILGRQTRSRPRWERSWSG